MMNYETKDSAEGKSQVPQTPRPKPFSPMRVLRRLRTELSKLPGSKQVLAPMQSWLPRVGVGFALRDLRDLDDAGLVRILLEVARRLNRMALSLGEEIGHRYFALADGPDQVRHT